MNQPEEKISELVYESLKQDFSDVLGIDFKFVDEAFNEDSAWENILDERDEKEVDFARDYSKNYAHGTAGHNRLMLIAKLSNLLDAYEEIVDRLIRAADKGIIG